jgi:ribose/xylose/arabinose/galactoside ABC-type transport system permease subunit
MNALKKLFGGNTRQFGMIFALVALIVFFQIFTEGRTLTPGNVINLFNGNSYILILAIGMVLVIIAGHIDLSVGSVAAFVGVSVALAIRDWGIPWYLGVLLGLALGALIGAWQGFWTAYVGIPAFIVTLAGMLLFRGFNQFVGKSNTIPVPNDFQYLGSGYLPEVGPSTGYNNLTLLLGLLAVAFVIFSEVRSRRRAVALGAEVPESWVMILKLVLICGAILYATYLFATGRPGTSFPIPGLILAVLVIIYGFISSKTIVGRQRPAEAVRQVQEQLKPWCDQNKVEPVKAWAGWNIGSKLGIRATAKDAQEQIEDGVAAIWMPNNLHANTFAKVGARPIWWDKTANPRYNTDPMEWDHAISVGAHYLMDGRGSLATDVQDVFRVIADKDVAVFFGHATHPEIFAMAEQVEKLGIKKAVVDHPFSPFVDLSADQMRQLNNAGIYMNFTYDEISPLLGVDPAIMCKTIQALGTQYVTLSSDCGEPLFPNSVEGMRQIRAYMRAFGLTDEQVEQISVANPAKVVGLA